MQTSTHCTAEESQWYIVQSRGVSQEVMWKEWESKNRFQEALCDVWWGHRLRTGSRICLWKFCRKIRPTPLLGNLGGAPRSKWCCPPFGMCAAQLSSSCSEIQSSKPSWTKVSLCFKEKMEQGWKIPSWYGGELWRIPVPIPFVSLAFAASAHVML